jgi:hypothetical protein
MRQGAELERACDAEIQPVGKHSIQGLRDIVIAGDPRLAPPATPDLTPSVTRNVTQNIV